MRDGFLILAESLPPQWWQITTGILAIPASIIGLVYSYLLVTKTRLESLKLQLEIREKSAALDELWDSEAKGDSISHPLAESAGAQYLLLRFVILYLIIHTWSLVEQASEYLGLSLYAAAAYATTGDINGFEPGEHLWITIPAIAITKIPKFAYWVVFLAIAWPLFRDINVYLRMNLRDYFRWGSKRST